MLHYEALRQLSHDRGERLRHQAAAEHLARQARGRQQQRRRRLALAATLDLILRSRSAEQQGTRA